MDPEERPLDVVVRFSTSNPDLILNVQSPSYLSNLSLKQRIRAQLHHPASTSRLRLIHSGRVLAGTVALSKSVTVTLPPPQDEGKSEKAKGKLPVRDTAPAPARVYVHCSIGDALTPGELTAEAKAAQDADLALKNKTAQSTNSAGQTDGGRETTSTTTPAPRGFDRLVSAGFTTSEVAALRTQFLAIQAHTHTPDTMPTGPDLLALEERWLDNTDNPAAAGGEMDTGGFGSEDAGGLEDMLYGNLIGFFWPIGAMCWLMREEGVWSRRRQIAILSGFLVNITFGLLRVLN